MCVWLGLALVGVTIDIAVDIAAGESDILNHSTRWRSSTPLDDSTDVPGRAVGGRCGRRFCCCTLSPQTALVVRRFPLGRREVCIDVDGCAGVFVRRVSQEFRSSLNVASLIAGR